MERDVKIKHGEEYEFERCMEAEPKTDESGRSQENVFARLDSIIMEILTLKKELTGKMNSTA